jgi:hypothetical protein
MANRRRFIPTVIAAAVMALFLPLIASAQGNYDWGRNRRDRDYDDDDYYGRNNRFAVRDSVRRLDSAARNLQRELDRELDRDDREDGTRHEDRLNDVARSFRQATNDLKNRVGDGRDLDRSAGEARRVLDLGRRLGNRIEHHFDNLRLRANWHEIQHELRLIGNVYGRDRGYGDARNDDDRYRRPRDRRNNNEWWRRLPLPY